MSKCKTTLLPVMKTRQDEIDSIVFMKCAVKRFEEAQDVMESRLRRVQNGWRDIRLVTSVLDRLFDRIIDTVPPEKIETLNMQMPDTRVRITYTRQFGRGQDDVTGIRQKDLDLLAAAAHDGVCKLCDGNCDRCDLGKVLDRFLNTQRDKGESYTFMQVGNGYDAGDIRKGK